jgi:hypothetical protein
MYQNNAVPVLLSMVGKGTKYKQTAKLLNAAVLHKLGLQRRQDENNW